MKGSKYFIFLICFYFLTSATAVSVPRKYKDFHMTRPATGESHFSNASIASGDYVLAKSAEWRACRQRKPKHSAHIGAFEAIYDPITGGRDAMANFLQNTEYIRKISDMEYHHLLEGKVATQPWSGDFWPYASGLLSARYLDPVFVQLFTWKSRYEYTQENSVPKILENYGQLGVNTLSPAEKYDLLIGSPADENLGIALWQEGAQYADEQGNVEGWMGICHGWAPASIAEPRPASSLSVKSLDQKYDIPLNPSEIKGLVSYSWATNYYSQAMLGQRCNKKNPKTDENGRVIDPECFDLNPGTWHLAMINMVGVQRRSFVMDATYDFEVWNQPVLGYSYTYINPSTGHPTDRFTRAAIPRSQYTQDPYAKYRSPETDRILGVVMRVGYVVETSANGEEVDTMEMDRVRWVQYEYDLELNKKDEIIGGEWHQVAHPDFIWTPLKGVKPESPLEDNASTSPWDPKADVLPQSWANAAKAEAPRAFILHKITESIVKAASRQGL